MEKLPKPYKRAYRESTKIGWRWSKRTNHIEVRDARGEYVVTVSTTQYDGALTKRVLTKLRRAGCPAC